MLYCFEESWMLEIQNCLTTCADSWTNTKNSAYRRYWIPECVRKGAPITKRTKRAKRGKGKKQRKNQMSCFLCQVSCVRYYVSPVTCPLSPRPNAKDLPLLTSPLCTAGWFAKTQQPKNISISKNLLKWKRKNTQNIQRSTGKLGLQVGTHTNRQESKRLNRHSGLIQ